MGGVQEESVVLEAGAARIVETPVHTRFPEIFKIPVKQPSSSEMQKDRRTTRPGSQVAAQ